ncbi:MAG: GNAT family N-acetyltransferase [Clostridia bacterium]|nr:GNAT family N-acetyltransferase [Clostridia bacterium]
MPCIHSHSVRLTGTYPSGTLVLRPASDDDILLLCELNSDPRALEWSDSGAEPYDEQTVREIWGYVSPNALCFIIEADGTPIGDCWLQRMNLPDVIAKYPQGTDIRRIDLSIGKVDYWNRGIGTEVIRLLADYAFREDSADVLHCMCDIANVRSNRIWQKNGFRLAWSEPGAEYEQHYVLTREDYTKSGNENLAGGNLFMMCPQLNEDALRELPEGYHIRNCRKEELDLWKTIHFDNPSDAEEQFPYMTEYFRKVYEPAGSEFWKRCVFLCDADDVPVGTCFAWKAYGCITTIHWYKIRKDCEGRGLGRVLLSQVMRSIPPEDYPVYLHTHPGCFRAIKLYTDFGFVILRDTEVGFRKNDREASLPYLRKKMPVSVYESLRFADAPEKFLAAVKTTEFSQF